MIGEQRAQVTGLPIRAPCLPQKKRAPAVGLVLQACNPSTWEVKAGGSGVYSQAQLHRAFETSLNSMRLYDNESKQTKKECGDKIFEKNMQFYS